MSKQKITLPPEMVEKYVNLYGYKVIRSGNGDLNCCCPICHEGKSWGRKRRLYYFKDKGFLYCFNCNQSWSDMNWIKTVSGMSYKDIMAEASRYSNISIGESKVYFTNSSSQQSYQPEEKDLPDDTITLDSQLQTLYYSGNKIVQIANDFIKKRRLDKAINVPKYGISLTDRIHKNRIVIPFTDLDGNIAFYQTRKLMESDFLPKYLSKRDSEKTVFGIDKVDVEYPYLFITEGPIDSCFIKNGVSLAGLKYTNTQLDQLSNFFSHDRIWVLDNDFRTNPTVMEQYEKLIENGEKIFIWPEKYNGIKDINEYCTKFGKNSFDENDIIEHSHSGLRATQILKGLKL